MKTWLKKFAIGSALIAAFALSAIGLSTPAAQAATCDPNSGSISGGVDCAAPANADDPLFGSDNSLFQRVTGILIFLIGVISVIMLIIGGIRYAVSGGDQSAVTAAKNTILYAIIGLVVAFLAFGISSFVINFLQGDTGS